MNFGSAPVTTDTVSLMSGQVDSFLSDTTLLLALLLLLLLLLFFRPVTSSLDSL